MSRRNLVIALLQLNAHALGGLRMLRVLILALVVVAVGLAGWSVGRAPELLHGDTTRTVADAQALMNDLVQGPTGGAKTLPASNVRGTGDKREARPRLFHICEASLEYASEEKIAACTEIIELIEGGESWLFDAYNSRGIDYTEYGWFDSAIKDFNHALVLKPGSDMVINNRGFVYAAKGQYDAAIKDYTEALRAEPKHVGRLNNRGVAYAKKGQFELAIADFTRATQIEPHQREAYSGRCWAIAISKGNLDTALADCNRALEGLMYEPGRGAIVAYSRRGLLFFLKGNFDGAITDSDDALGLLNQIGSSRYDYRRLRALPAYIRGAAKIRKGNTAGGNADIATAKRIDPKVADEYARYGVTP